MVHFPSFLLGTFAGIYIAQNYDVPDAKKMSEEFGDNKFIINTEKGYKIT